MQISTSSEKVAGFKMAHAVIDYTDVMMQDLDVFAFASRQTHEGFWQGLSLRLSSLKETDAYYNPELQQKAASNFNRLSFFN